MGRNRAAVNVVLDEHGLTPEQARFVSEYQKDWNATAAMIRCGIGSEANRDPARQAGYKMLCQVVVKDAIYEIEKARAAKCRTSVQDVEMILSDLAHVDILDIFDSSGDVRPLAEIPPEARRAIAGIDVERGDNGEIKAKRVKLWDKKAAAELLGKYRRMFTERIDVGGADGGPLKVSINIDAKG